MFATLRSFKFPKPRVPVAQTKRLVFAVLASLAPMAAHAESLNIICVVQADWCSAVKNEFEKQTGIRVNVIQKGGGEALAQIAAEKQNPKIDIWFGGGGDPHLQAAEQDLTLSYKSPALSQLHDWARRQAEQSNYHTVGIYAGALGFGYNTELLAKKKLPAPTCWKDLLKPEYKDEIQVGNPNATSTAYVAIATLVQLMGEEDAFKYLRDLHKNINQYTRTGSGAIKSVARGETSVSVSYIHDGINEAVNGFPVKVTTPCEGTGYEIGSMSIIKGARNLDSAKKFYDWALTPQAQKLGTDAKAFQLMSNVSSTVAPQAPKFREVKLIDYNFAKYGSVAERTHLLERWQREVGNLPK